MIDRYGLRLATRFDGGKLVKTGNILISRSQLVQKDNALADIKAAKPEIIACLEAQETAERAALEERERKIAAIPGLKEIQAAQEDVAAWNKEFRESFEDVGGLGVRKKPEYDFDAMFAEYPVAAAYLKALSYSMTLRLPPGKPPLTRFFPVPIPPPLSRKWNPHGKITV